MAPEMAVAEAASCRMVAAGTSSPRQVVRAEPASGTAWRPRAADGPLPELPPSPSAETPSPSGRHPLQRAQPISVSSGIPPRKAVATNAAELRVRDCPPPCGSPPAHGARGTSGGRREVTGGGGGERGPPDPPSPSPRARSAAARADPTRERCQGSQNDKSPVNSEPS